MALPIEQLYKARDFLNLKNISANHVELSFKNPVIAMLAKGKVAEIASQCSPDGAFTKCEMHGNDLHLDFNPEYVSERLMAEILTQRLKEPETLHANWLPLSLKRQ